MKKSIACLTFLLLMTNGAHSSFQSVREATEIRQPSQGIIEAHVQEAMLHIEVLKDNIIHIRFTRDRTPAPSYAVVYKGAPAAFQYQEKTDAFEILTPALRITVHKNPCRISFHDRDGNLINEDEKSFGVMWDADEVRCFKRLLPGEHFFGLGEKTGCLERRGTQCTMWNTDYPFYPKEQDPLYASIPFFMGVREHRAYGIFFDNTHRSTFCMGAGNDRFYWFGADRGDMDYYFIYGPSMKTVLGSYTELTGRMDLPPLWSLGFQQSRWSYESEPVVREVAHQFRSRSIPCDVIYLDIDYMKGYRVFTWDETRFPDPEKMLRDLRKEGFKVIPIIDPGVKADSQYSTAQEGLEKGLFACYPDGEPYKGEVWPSWAYFPDFTLPQARQWWGEKLSTLLKQGAAGFWNDMNEPAVWGKYMPDIVQFDDNGHKADHRKIHNVYALAMAQATHEALEKYSDERHLVLTRAGFSGIQRYAAMWTGDNYANEDHLLMACLMPQSMGLSGLPFVGSDVGGFGGMPSEDLYIRWMQLGAFTPFFRAHSCIDAPRKEPWALGKKVEELSREAITMRYRFLPYLYGEFRRAAQTGLPVMRPMVLNFQQDPECYKEEAQKEFMIGESLLVAPVLSSRDVEKKLYLPEGKWLGWNGRQVHQGRRWLTVRAPLSEIPLFIREGGIIPLQKPMQHTGERKVDEMEFVIFPALGARYELYEDDGESLRYRQGAYTATEVAVSGGPSWTISCAERHRGYDGATSRYLFRIYMDSEPAGVTVKGKRLPRRAHSYSPCGSWYSYDGRHRELIIAVNKQPRFAVTIHR